MFFSGIKKGDKLYPVHDGRFEPNPATPSMTQDCGITEDGKIKTDPSGGIFTKISTTSADEISLLPDGAYVSKDEWGTWSYWLKGTAMTGVTLYEFECMDDGTSCFYIHYGTEGDVQEVVSIDATGSITCGDIRLGTSGAGKLLFGSAPVAMESDLPFVVTGWYDGDQLGSFNKTFDEIETASSSGKIVLLRLFTDENISYYTLPMAGNDGQGTITFAGLDAVNYEGQTHNIVIVTVDSADTWNISHPDYAVKSELEALKTRVAALEA